MTVALVFLLPLAVFLLTYGLRYLLSRTRTPKESAATGTRHVVFEIGTPSRTPAARSADPPAPPLRRGVRRCWRTGKVLDEGS